MKKNLAFTLIELLVVIAIIVILAAILFPVFAAAREKARQVTCISNEGQIGKAIMAYIGDWNDTYPRSRFCTGVNYTSGPDNYTANKAYNWRRAIWSYIKNYDSRSCPSNKWAMKKQIYPGYWSSFQNEGGCESNKFYPKDQWIPNSYAYNGDFFHERLGVRKMAQMTATASLILLLECRMWWTDIQISQPQSNGPSAFDSGLPDGLGNKPPPIPGLNIHSSGVLNYAFADGHVKAMKLRATAYPTQMYTSEVSDQAAFQGHIDTWLSLYPEYR